MSSKIEVDVRGEMLDLKETVNSLVDQLRLFASEVCWIIGLCVGQYWVGLKCGCLIGHTSGQRSRN